LHLSGDGAALREKNGRKLSSELQVLILHGVLHLLGYDHETIAAKWTG